MPAIYRNRYSDQAKKNGCRPQPVQRLGQLVSQASAPSFPCSFFRRKSQRRPRGENHREADFFAGRRPARSHCEKRGGSGGAGASARSGCAKNVVFCARSASDGDGTRDFSPCLTFWYFWVKPKVRKKNMPVRGTTWSAPQTSLRKFFLLFLSKKEPKKTARRK